MSPRDWRRLGAGALAAGWMWLLECGLAFARAGGGHGYSGGGGGGGGGGGSFGGGSSGGSGGGGGGGDILGLIWFLVQLTIQYPKAMLPIWGGIALWWFFGRDKNSAGDNWSMGLREGRVGESSAPTLWRTEIEKMRAFDPDFSVVVFEDFLYALYARVQEARGAQRLEALAPYLRREVREALERSALGLSGVQTVIVGSLSYTGVKGIAADAERIEVELRFEANYTELDADRRPTGYYVEERWTLSRARSARSRPPDKARSLGCPSCGAPLLELKGDVCAYCSQPLTPGDFDWVVERIRVIRRERRGPQLTTSAVEQGTDTPTIVDPEAQARLAALQQRDPAFQWDAFAARVKHVYVECQAAWSALDLPRARPYLSDNIFETWRYWIFAYQKAGLRNATDGARVLGMRMARVTSDAYYDAITVRIHAIGLDYTVDAAGNVVSGNAREPREYSEYWTLIRGTSTRGAARTERNCPRCAAELKVNMAGECEYCAARVTTGDFDWVLSRIEQDETYQG